VAAVGATTERQAIYFDSARPFTAAPFFSRSKVGRARLGMTAPAPMKSSVVALKIRAVSLLIVKMNPLRIGIPVFAAVLFLVGCKPSGKAITELQRKEAAHAQSEAQFAVTMRQWDRAEGLYAKAAQLCPDTGEYWFQLGVVRVRLGKRDIAKEAYKNAAKAFEDEAGKTKDDVEPWLKQAEVLALLGRATEGRATLEKASKRFPNDRTVRAFAERYDRLIAEPNFLQNALKP
jgi:tetratricopeptide (TPR) repeat protein